MDQTCINCGKSVPDLERFPGPRCLGCHAARFDAAVASNGGVLPRPDFVAAVKAPALNGYVCFYNRQRIEVYAATSYAAQLEVARKLKVPVKKQHLISVTLCERADGSQVVHTATE